MIYNFSAGDIYLVAPLFIQLFISVYIIFTYTLRNNNTVLFLLFLRLFQFHLSGALSDALCIPLICSHHCRLFLVLYLFIFKPFLIFWHYKMLQAHLIYFGALESAISLGCSGFFNWKMNLKTKIWVLSATEVFLLLEDKGVLLSRRTEKLMYVWNNPRLYSYL